MHLRALRVQRLDDDAHSCLDGGYPQPEPPLVRWLRRPRRAAVRHAPALLSMAIIASIGYGAYAWFNEGGSPWAAGELSGVWSSWLGVILDPWFTGFLVGMAILQWKFPADRNVRLRSPGVAQDMFWYMYGPLRDVTIIAASLTAIGFAFDHFTQAELNLVPTLGVGGVAVLAFVVGDFAAWGSHILHHRFPLLWEFHKVHHSQREMSFMTDNREHFVETIINAAVVFVPAKLLGLETEAAGALAFLSNYLQTLSHANIRTNLGPLRFILVSPQYHRVHHSILREHYNINYGSVLSVWDYMFRTFFPDKDCYPPTGINDEDFPLEQSTNPLSVAHTWWKQTLYPFKVHYARWRAHGAPAEPTPATPADVPALAASSLDQRARVPLSPQASAAAAARRRDDATAEEQRALRAVGPAVAEHISAPLRSVVAVAQTVKMQSGGWPGV
jgi:sterol desaturase/sphingolipid hydroxylase (fatty acid hydroxylase superfamily)